MVPLAPVSSFIPYSIHKRASKKGALKSYLVELVKEVNEGKRMPRSWSVVSNHLMVQKIGKGKERQWRDRETERPVGWSGGHGVAGKLA